MNKSSENSVNTLPGDAEIESRARAIFRNACENVDSYHALRLGLARRKAANARAGHHSALRVWAPLTGAAACCVLVVGVMWMHPLRQAGPAGTVVSSAPLASGPIDAQEEATPEIGSNQMEIAQDLDFYRWLAAQPTVASANRGGSR